jgi:hypothetical protein
MAILNTPGFSRLNQVVEYETIEIVGPRSYGTKKTYVYDCRAKNEDPNAIVKWCRRNFGYRGDGWDFHLISGRVTIEITKDEFKTMYEMWKL